jgi:DNA end-binding protein Ku
MAARSMWTGSISFGLVNIPVKLYNAIREERVAFHMLHDQDKSRLRRKLVSEASGKEVHNEHIVKGYEIAKDQYVVVTQEELDSVSPEESRTVDIRSFVDLDEIDPVYYDRPYYLAPAEHAARPYRLLLDAMSKAHKVGIAKFVMRNHEYLAALRPQENGLVLDTMHFHHEIVPMDSIPGLPVTVKVEDREMKVAMQLIESLADKFNPGQFKDEYRDRVMEMVKRKAEGEEIVTQPAVGEKPGRVTDLMAALEASLAKARGGGAAAASKNGGGTATKTEHKTATRNHKGEAGRGHTRRRKSA